MLRPRLAESSPTTRYPADFIRENLEIQTSVIDASYQSGVKRLLFLGSSCIYPKLAPQPIKEEYLLTGPLEPTNRAYALAKIAGIEMCWSYNRQYGTRYLAAMPTNLYGPGTQFDPVDYTCLPALIRKVAHAKQTGEKRSPSGAAGLRGANSCTVRISPKAALTLINLSDPLYDSLLGEGSGSTHQRGSSVMTRQFGKPPVW